MQKLLDELESTTVKIVNTDTKEVVDTPQLVDVLDGSDLCLAIVDNSIYLCDRQEECEEEGNCLGTTKKEILASLDYGYDYFNWIDENDNETTAVFSQE